MLRFKDGVSVYGLQPEMLLALDKCCAVWPTDITVTSARYDAHHSHKSRHYSGLAVDLRSRDINSDIDGLLANVREILGESYDVVKESDHIHIEYDPKTRREYAS